MIILMPLLLLVQELETIATFAAVPGTLDSPRDRGLRRTRPYRTPSAPEMVDDPLTVDQVRKSLDGDRGKQPLVIPPFRPRRARGADVHLPRAHSAAATLGSEDAASATS